MHRNRFRRPITAPLPQRVNKVFELRLIGFSGIRMLLEISPSPIQVSATRQAPSFRHSPILHRLDETFNHYVALSDLRFHCACYGLFITYKAVLDRVDFPTSK